MGNLEETLKAQFRGKKVLIVGLGLQGGGVGLAKFFAELGAKVTVTDKKTKEQLVHSVNTLKSWPITFTLGTHLPQEFLESDVIFKGPSVPWELSVLIEAKKRNIPIELEASFFASLCPAPIIAVTGTRGKSTTTTMIYELLTKLSGKRIHLAGNLPQTSTIQLLKEVQPKDLVLLELSSWQLSGFHLKKISPHIAVFTNFYPDHLNLYSSLEKYLFDKKAIYLYQNKSDYLIVNENLKIEIATDKPKGNLSYFSADSFPQPLRRLQGTHNRENAAAALNVAKVLQLNIPTSIRLLADFHGLPYRQQNIGQKDGIVFINDTTSTTPTATIKALDTFKDHPIILILGGNSKKLPTDVLINQLIDTRKIILLKGSFTDEILTSLKEKYPEKITEEYDNLQKAVQRAYDEALLLTKTYNLKPVHILFSPAATSFAMFNNEFHRGDEFNTIVKNLYEDSKAV